MRYSIADGWTLAWRSFSGTVDSLCADPFFRVSSSFVSCNLTCPFFLSVPRTILLLLVTALLLGLAGVPLRLRRRFCMCFAFIQSVICIFLLTTLQASVIAYPIHFLLPSLRPSSITYTCSGFVFLRCLVHSAFAFVVRAPFVCSGHSLSFKLTEFVLLWPRVPELASRPDDHYVLHTHRHVSFKFTFQLSGEMIVSYLGYFSRSLTELPGPLHCFQTDNFAFVYF